MKVLIIGSGGREHSLAVALGRDPDVSQVICCPGNAGVARHYTCKPVSVSTVANFLEVALREQPDLTVVGPEQPLADGIVNVFQANGLRIFGPTQEAAMITEGSKIACKLMLTEAGVPTAEYYVAYSPEDACHYAKVMCERYDGTCVIKADELALGKGVVVADSYAAAESAINSLMVKHKLGEHVGKRVLVERRLYGPELSLILVTNGYRVEPWISARDYKELSAKDKRNTGGMGAEASRHLSAEHQGAIMEKIIHPTLAALERAGTPYMGGLYAGLMLTNDGPQLVEYNCRLGDPETQATSVLIKSGLFQLLWAATEPEPVDLPSLSWSDDYAVSVVLAAPGYPGTPVTGGQIFGFESAKAEGATLHWAGVKGDERNLYVGGGRVVTVTGVGATKLDAREQAYRAVAQMSFQGGMQFRDDIALVP